MAARKPPSSTTTAGRGSGASCSASSTSSITCCPSSTRVENVVLPQLVRGAEPQAARERARGVARHAWPVGAARPSSVQAVGRRAAARRRRPGARQQAAAGACRRADRQPRRAYRRYRVRRIPEARPRRGQRGAGRDAQRTHRGARWTASSGCTKGGSNSGAGPDGGVQARVRSSIGRRSRCIGGLVVARAAGRLFRDQRECGPGQADQRRASRATTAPSREKLCASKPTYDLIKRELFRRAAQLRGSDQAAYDKLVGLRGGPDGKSGHGKRGRHDRRSQLLGLAVARPSAGRRGGRRPPNSDADIDYTVQPAADGSGTVVLLRNADAIITPLATLARVSAADDVRARAPAESNGAAPQTCRVDAAADCPTAGAPAAGRSARPSFDCAKRGPRRDCGLRRCRACGARPQHGRPIWPRDGRGDRRAARAPAPDARPLPRLSRPLPEPSVHRRRLRRPDARDPRHHGRPLAAPR